MYLVQRTKYYLEYRDDEEALAKLNGVVYWRDLELEEMVGKKINFIKWDSNENSEIGYKWTKEGVEVSNTGEVYGVVYTPNFTLEPNRQYELLVSLTGEGMNKNMAVRVSSINGTAIQIREELFLKNDVTEVFTIPFTTTNDIEPEGQRIMFDHLGGTDGSFIVKSFMIRTMQ